MGELISLCALRARKEADKRAEEEAAKIAAELAESEEIERMLKLIRGIVESFGEELHKPYRLSLEEMDKYAPEFTVDQWWFHTRPPDGYTDDT